VTIAEIYRFARQHKLAVVATSSISGQPEAAVVGIAITEKLELVFDTLNSSRKYKNIKQNPAVAVVIGWDRDTTVQLEGEATELSGPDAEAYREAYFTVYPDGRERAANWPGLVHFMVKPAWVRYSCFEEPAVIEEFKLNNLSN